MMKFIPHIKFNYNPFGGLTDEELMLAIVPKESINPALADLKKDQKTIIEFVGKKGRGKTTHLKLLHKLYGKGELHRLSGTNKSLEPLMKNPEEVIFVDSIHHLKLLDRLKLFRTKSKVVFTTHHSRILEFKLANVAYSSYRFKGISSEELVQLLENRISLAAENEEKIILDKVQVDDLIKKYNDDYRAILKHLYNQFESL